MVTGRAAGTPVETWTVLFTDQVGSTAMRVAMGEDAFDRVRADLDRCVDAALAEHGAVVTKSTGDGVMAGFTSTAAALRCAVAIHRQRRDDPVLGRCPRRVGQPLRMHLRPGIPVAPEGAAGAGRDS
jgi:class 3 adenylate cyclase